MTEIILNKNDFCRLIRKISKKHHNSSTLIKSYFCSSHQTPQQTFYQLNQLFHACFGVFAGTKLLGWIKYLTSVHYDPKYYKLQKHSDGYIKLIR